MLIFSFLKITNKWSKIQVVKHEKYQLSTCYTITYTVMCINEIRCWFLLNRRATCIYLIKNESGDNKGAHF